jgi:hypothetical protein
MLTIADDAGSSHQGIGEPDRRCHGFLDRTGRLLQDPPAQSRALGEVTGGKLSNGTVEHGLGDWRAAPEILPAAKRRP